MGWIGGICTHGGERGLTQRRLGSVRSGAWREKWRGRIAARQSWHQVSGDNSVERRSTAQNDEEVQE
jgi:hypothetical protein